MFHFHRLAFAQLTNNLFDWQEPMANKIELCIEDNLNQQTIPFIVPADDDKPKEPQQEDEQPKEEDLHHPIYDITSFPEIKLPQIMNPEETLMPEPIWMKKGNKIIADISEKNETEQYTKDHSLSALRLDSRLIDALKLEGYKSYFPVQRNVIPAVIRGMTQKRDIAVCAPTGSGKTLSYILPICHVRYCIVTNSKFVNFFVKGFMQRTEWKYA